MNIPVGLSSSRPSLRRRRNKGRGHHVLKSTEYDKDIVFRTYRSGACWGMYEFTVWITLGITNSLKSSFTKYRLST